MSDYDVVIAGAGVGGAALALALARAALRILVVERRSGPGNVNRGDSLLPTVTAHLGAWGALDRLRAAGARAVATMQVFHPRAGLVMEAPLDGPSDRPYLVLPHAHIERVLAEAAVASGRVELRYRCRVAGLREAGGRVCGVELADEAGARRSVSAALVVGADGSASTVRAALGVPLPSLPYDHGYFVVDVERPAGYRDAMRLHLHPDGGVLVVPGRDGVGVAALVHPRHEALFRAGPLAAKLAEVARRVPLLDGCGAAPGAHLYKLARGHAPRYVARGAALLGDAVHVTNPTAGQGMTMAIEDAAALAAAVAPLLVAGADAAALDAALAGYERARWPANARLIGWSHWMSRFYALDGAVGDALQHRLFALGGSWLGRRVHHQIWRRVAARAAA